MVTQFWREMVTGEEVRAHPLCRASALGSKNMVHDVSFAWTLLLHGQPSSQVDCSGIDGDGVFGWCKCFLYLVTI